MGNEFLILAKHYVLVSLNRVKTYIFVMYFDYKDEKLYNTGIGIVCIE